MSLKLFITDIIIPNHFPSLRIEIPCNLTLLILKRDLKMHFYDSLLTEVTVFANNLEGKLESNWL